MLKTRLLHPGILRALGEAGHGSQVLIAADNYPLLTRSNSAAYRVYLNLSPGQLTVTDILRVLVDTIPIETARTMAPDEAKETGISADFRLLLPDTPLQPLDHFEFYERACGPGLALAIATGEQRVYANVLLTIGVVTPRHSRIGASSTRPTMAPHTQPTREERR